MDVSADSVTAPEAIAIRGYQNLGLLEAVGASIEQRVGAAQIAKLRTGLQWHRMLEVTGTLPHQPIAEIFLGVLQVLLRLLLEISGFCFVI